MDENLNLQSAARRNAYNMKMQAYNEKYHPHAPEESKPPMSDHPVSLIDATLLEARIATGEATNATTADSLDEAMRRVEEAKQFIKNRSLLKTQTQANY
jgi:regulator of protease activity HflC (stomatin/prohibitin superfamily)